MFRYYVSVFRQRGPYLPTLCTHGTIISMSNPQRPKVLAGNEHLMAMGEDFDGISGNPSRIGAAAKLPTAVKKRLAGNSYCPKNFGNFVVYCMCKLRVEKASHGTRNADVAAGLFEDGVTPEEFGSPCVDWSMRGQRHTGNSTGRSSSSTDVVVLE